MLGKSNVHKVLMKINGKTINLCFNYKTIENLYYNLTRLNFDTLNPLTFINNLSQKKDISNSECYILLSSFVNGQIKEEDLVIAIDNKQIDKNAMLINLITLISQEVNADDIFTKSNDEDNNNEIENNNEFTNEQDIKNFMYFWDNSYYIAKVLLKLSDKDFYNTTPKTLYTLQQLDKRYRRDILLERDIEIEKAKIKAINNENTDNNKENTKVEYVSSLGDLFK